jgi:hypothetical protein
MSSKMSKLSTVIKTLEVLKGFPEEMHLPLPSTRKNILEKLDLCMMMDLEKWHQTKICWIKATKCQSLERLCNNVIRTLLPAFSKTKLLWNVMQGNTRLPDDITHRLILTWTLVDIEKSFKTFEVMSTDPSLKPHYIRAMVLRYLERVYELMLLLGQLYFPPDSDICIWWFSDAWQYLKEERLWDFEFDGAEHYKRVEDRTLAGVLADSSEVPELYLPATPQPPIYYRNQGPYGPPILKNHLMSCRSTPP